jgi:hypothetical protein
MKKTMNYKSSRKRDRIESKIVHIVKHIPLKYRENNNNLLHPEWGSENQELLRKSSPAYENGTDAPAGSNRKSARVVSNVIFDQKHPTKNSKGASALFPLFGQYIDHDLALTPEGTEHFDIPVPLGDPYFDPEGEGDKYIHFLRSIFNPESSPRQQINVITSFLDAGNLYGEGNRTRFCREFRGGRLKYSEGHMLPYNNGDMENAGGNGIGLYVAGDIRCNENLALICMHTLWMREHNYWCKKLRCTGWSDEKIFQTVRVIVESEYQSIVFREFLPLLLGEKLKYKGYDSHINPGIFTEFSTGAYRFGHSVVNRKFGREDLKDSFFCPFKLTNNGGLNPVFKILSNESANELDAKVISDLRNFLFGNPGEGGLDLVSLNIQRGRDHGIADFNSVREAYGLKKYTRFSQISDDSELVKSLQEIYNGDINNIDLWVGILSEKPYKNAMIGELGYYIIKDQFERVRNGDRFWYEHRLPRKLVKLINKNRLSDVILRNTDLCWINKYCMMV